MASPIASLTSLQLPTLTTQQLSAFTAYANGASLMGGGGGTGNYYYTANGTSTSNIGSNFTTSSFKAEIRYDSLYIKDVDVGKTLEDIKSRLAIITPDLQKLEKFTALKRAYDNYKMIEAMCITNNQCSP